MALVALTPGVRLKTVTVNAPSPDGTTRVDVTAEQSTGFGVKLLGRDKVEDVPSVIATEGAWNAMISDFNAEAE